MSHFGIKFLLFMAAAANLLVLVTSAAHNDSTDDFLECLVQYTSSSILDHIYTPSNASYSVIYESAAPNLRPVASNSSRLRPLLILTPYQESEIQAAVYCSKRLGVQIRVRSGGHDFEGLSYTSTVPFAMIDMRNYRSICICTKENTAWIQTGATLGELYFALSKTSKTLAFPAGVCNSVGVGGQFSGGGYGMMSRKHGLTIDKIIDARIIDANGRSLDRKSMGDDLFWAIRGGGATSFGIILSFKDKFPELGLVEKDCIEMSWIESELFFADLKNQPLEALLNRTYLVRLYFKTKSDYVRQPIPKHGLEGIWKFLKDEAIYRAQLQFSPYGGVLNSISESETPFPHRAGNIYMVEYVVGWTPEDNSQSEIYINWIRNFYSYMAPYVSNSPRAAYSNYRDLDIGMNSEGSTSYEEASVWGLKYYKNNFDRLVRVKTKVDPSNLFRNEQSIPPMHSQSYCEAM